MKRGWDGIHGFTYTPLLACTDKEDIFLGCTTKLEIKLKNDWLLLKVTVIYYKLTFTKFSHSAAICHFLAFCFIFG